jgi:hypothetical protein
MDTLVKRLKEARPTHDIRVRCTRWMDEVVDESSKRLVKHRDGGTSEWGETVCEVMTASSLRRKCFRDYKVGDILVNRKKVANIHEDYKVLVIRRPERMRKYYTNAYMFDVVQSFWMA